MTKGVGAGPGAALFGGEALSCMPVADDDGSEYVLELSVCVGAVLMELACAVEETITDDDPASSGGRKNIAWKSVDVVGAEPGALEVETIVPAGVLDNEVAVPDPPGSAVENVEVACEPVTSSVEVSVAVTTMLSWAGSTGSAKSQGTAETMQGRTMRANAMHRRKAISSIKD